MKQQDELDCSELVEAAFAWAGLSIPDGSFAQYDFCRPVQEPKIGDLGFLWSNKWNRIGHVEIYMGDGHIIGAVGGSVGQVRIRDSAWLENHPRFRGWRRHPDFMRPMSERPLSDKIDVPGLTDD